MEESRNAVRGVIDEPVLKLCHTDLAHTEPVVSLLAGLGAKHNVDFVLSVSSDPEELPDFLKQYLI